MIVTLRRTIKTYNCKEPPISIFYYQNASKKTSVCLPLKPGHAVWFRFWPAASRYVSVRLDLVELYADCHVFSPGCWMYPPVLCWWPPAGRKSPVGPPWSLWIARTAGKTPQFQYQLYFISVTLEVLESTGILLHTFMKPKHPGIPKCSMWFR